MNNLTFFFESTDKSYMAFESEEYHHECMRKKYPQRVNLWHFNNNHKLIAKLYRKSHFIDVVSKLIPRQNVNKYLWGSWFTWNIQTAKYVLKYLDKHPEFYKRFNHTYCGDELIFQTMLKPVMDMLKIDGEHPLRFVSWRSKRPIKLPYRPYTLNELDYDYVINSASFFCRKVDLPESSRLLDMIDAQRGDEFDIWKAERIL